MTHFDVLIVGAGLSGIGAAYHLQERCPGKSFAILEARGSMGGTWDLFRYPGIRSDSDMYTLGYRFKPWREQKSLADGSSIRAYIHETAAENDLIPHIRFDHRVTAASWSSAEAQWTVETRVPDQQDPVRFRCSFLFMCSGYYRYEKGHTPAFEGIERFRGPVIHPQDWPEDLDYAGQRVVVIGSGATAVTLVPAMAEKAAHVTMLQRSPTYMMSRPDEDPIADFLRKIAPARLAYALTRFKNIQTQRLFYSYARRQPARIKALLIDRIRRRLGSDYDVEKHFTPRYDPWDQRLCLVPNGDLFEAIDQGRVSVVTDRIDCFNASGIRLASGEQLEADLIVTATGLDLLLLGGIRFSVDGVPVDFSRTYTYKGMMYSDVPNLAQTFGYVNASWTLRADLTSEYVCRLLNRMDELGVRRCTPRLRPEDADMPALPWIDTFTPGYMQRGMHLFPRQGDRAPWRNTQSYALDKKMIRHSPLEDGALVFDNPAA